MASCSLSKLPEWHLVPASNLLMMGKSPFGVAILKAAAEFDIDLDELVVSVSFDVVRKEYHGLVQFRDYELNFRIPFHHFQDPGVRIVDGVVYRVIAQLKEAVDGKEIDRICKSIKLKSPSGKVRVIRMKGKRRDDTVGMEAGREQSCSVLRSGEDTVERRKFQNNAK